MNIALIIAGILLLSVGVFRSFNSPVVEEAAPASDSASPSVVKDVGPKANDHRIVKRGRDGRYVIEYYRNWPGWIEIKSDPGYATEQEARETLVAIEHKEPENQVITP